MKEQLKNVSHEYIRYSNCWEDADLLLEALQVAKGDRVLSIGSAGDNSFSLLTQDPEIVLAVDINPVQLHLIELKKAAILKLSHPQFLGFLGFEFSKKRRELFEQLKDVLPSESYSFWNNRFSEIESGLIDQGKFERYFRRFNSKILPWIHNKKTVEELFRPKSNEEQKLFFDKKWDTWRWRFMIKLFFNKFVMGRLGRDPEFLKEVKLNVANFMLEQCRRQLSDSKCTKNLFFLYQLTGSFGNELPHYAKLENFDVIKTRLDRLITFNGLAEEAFKKFHNFNRFNLSNIFEYMNPALFKSVSENIVRNSEPGSLFAYWNLMVPRRMAKVSKALTEINESSKLWSEKDKGCFYTSFNLDQKK